ncbi:hypothetical protein B0A55_00967 [Friedmanniomyces simplex]|uniref:Probable endonuclease LCL3 n=1 Tax=Friedmanniomyces simplex TaxID=329884 RepID=A0A4U0XXZ7_9PEZI|nr:hypothetical protein B0A55_00967 [Friedmanniomyces simplex]
MQWPDWLWTRHSKRTDDTTREAISSDDKPPSKAASRGSWATNLNSTDWSHYTTPQTITACVVTTATTLALIRLYKTYLRRIPTVNYLKPGLFRRRSLYGYVTSVGDADNFHLFHTPGGRLAGWGWLRGRKVQEMGKAQLKGKTVHVRIAGVDAPELGHFGKPTQPFGPEALEWLRESILHRYVRVRVYRRDQYERVVCMVWKRKWVVWRADVGYEMLKQGWATVYEAKFGSEFGDKEEQYRAAEKRAKERGLGMWREPGLVGRLLGREKIVETPREYKTRMAVQEKGGKTGEKGK